MLRDHNFVFELLNKLSQILALKLFSLTMMMEYLMSLYLMYHLVPESTRLQQDDNLLNILNKEFVGLLPTGIEIASIDHFWGRPIVF